MAKMTFPRQWAANYTNPLAAVAAMQCAPDVDWDRDIFLALVPTDDAGGLIMPHSLRWAPFFRRRRVRYEDRLDALDSAASLAKRFAGQKVGDVKADMLRGEKWDRIEQLLGADVFTSYIRDLPQRLTLAAPNAEL